MAIWRKAFERISFDFDPPVKQTADVVFETDIPFDDDHIVEFEEAAWGAMWEQNPHWADDKLCKPHPDFAGFSSVLSKGPYVEVKDNPELAPYFELGTPGDGKPRIGETFKVKGRDDEKYGYRVTGFYKTYVRNPKEFDTDAFLNKLIGDILEEERAKMTAEQRKRKDEMIKVIQCSREEAEFVSGAGVAGTIVRLEDVNIDGRVTWTDRTIARARWHYDKHLISHPDDFPTEMWKYWEAE